MPKFSDVPVDTPFLEQVEEASAEAIAYLAIAPPSHPADIIRAIDLAVYQLQKESRSRQKSQDKKSREVLVAILGALWGKVLCMTLDWEWSYVHLGEPPNTQQIVAVLPQDRSLVIFPFYFLDSCLNHEVEVTIELAFTILREGTRVPKLPPQTYENVMEHVFHDPPRA